MPTAAHLTAALWFAMTGWLAANAHIPAMGETPQIGWFREITALIGLICGWRVMGPAPGGNYADAFGSGLKTAIIMAFYALLFFSFWQMAEISLKGHYSDPLEALLGIVEQLKDNGRKMASIGVLGVLIVFGALGGLVTEAARRRWR